jgi:serine/threonine protein kinase
MELLKPGQVFAGRYRVERFLAQGGFGAVFVAEQMATEMRVAIKVLWPHVLSSKDAVEKFQLEARVAARVNSEHIVKVFDAGFDEATGVPFLVMELLHGESLEQRIASSGPLSAVEAHRCLAQVALGLDRAHGCVDKEGRPQPIVHRDLKPENLFLTRREDGETIVKILDFGIAKVLSNTSSVTQQARGTPLFMAFEQAAGRPVGPQTDVWALGLIAFYMLSGRLYWMTAENPDSGIGALFGEILSLPIVPPTQRLSELGVLPPWPPTFDAWFLRCVHRDMGQRFASAGEAVAALGVALGISSPVAPTSLRRAEHVPTAPTSAQAATAHAMAMSNGAPAAPKRRAARAALIAGAALAAGAAASIFAWRTHNATEPASASAGTRPGAGKEAQPPPPPPHAATAAPQVAPPVPTVAPVKDEVASAAADARANPSAKPPPERPAPKPKPDHVPSPAKTASANPAPPTAPPATQTQTPAPKKTDVYSER